jgi:hypothetical protein
VAVALRMNASLVFVVLVVSGSLSARYPFDQGAPSLQAPRSTYEVATGPVVAFDEAHHDTTYERYPALPDLLTADGYRTRRLSGRLSAASLSDVRVLFINNPGGTAALRAHAASVRANQPPDAEVKELQAAFLSDDELSTVTAWLKGGGSLLLIVDHPPFPLAAAKLTAALGIQNWPNGTAGIRHRALQAIGGHSRLHGASRGWASVRREHFLLAE